MCRVDRRDDGERDHVVDDEHGDEEDAEPLGVERSGQGQGSERERGVGRHRRAPPVLGWLTRVDDQEQGHRDEHPGDAGGQRQHGTTPLPQLADVELPPRLETDDEEEERHQPVVHPAAESERQSGSPDGE